MIRCSSSQFTSTTLTHLPSNPLRARRMTRGTGHSPPDVPSPPGNFSLEKILQRENVLTLFRIKTITLILYCYNRFVKVKVVVARRGIKYHRGEDGTGRGGGNVRITTIVGLYSNDWDWQLRTETHSDTCINTLCCVNVAEVYWH